jgi:chemotaxis protein MotA
MDIATIIGLLLGMGLIVGSIMIGGGGLGPFVNVPSIMITIGGAFSALLINFPLSSVIGMFGVVKNCFLTKLPSSKEVLDKFEQLAAVARRDGLLAIENNLDDIDDAFMRRGLEMVAAGTDREGIQSVLETEVAYISERHVSGKKILEALGASAPAFGMIGTLIGLVQMLRSLDDPSQIGVGMATALLTTMYGAVVANLFCIPMAGKLEQRNNEEVMIRELITMGVLSLVDGQTPRAVQERLVAFLAPKKRPDNEMKKAA